MRTVPANIQSAYYKLKKSRIITKNEFDEESISHFERVLNSALPVTEYDKNIYYFIKGLYYNDKQKFYNFINNSNYECLILYTDNIKIVNHFKLLYKLYISWDKENKKYIVKKYKNPSSSNSLSELTTFSQNSASSDR